MHNSGCWAHRSPVAVAGKVTQVIAQTNNRRGKKAPSRSSDWNIKHRLFDEATRFLKIREETYLKVQIERPIIHILLYCLFSFSGTCKFWAATKAGILLLASENYTCAEWILSASPTFCGLTPQFVHINDIPKCVWMALVPTQDLLFQRDANVVLSETPLRGPLLTARATV